MSNIKNILLFSLAVAIGLAVGYFIFGNKQSALVNHQHDNNHTPVSAAGEEIWTCAMHPQIRQNEFGECAICGMDLSLLEANSSNDPLVLEMTEEAVKIANIQTTTIGQAPQKAGKTLRLSGKIQADERLTSSQVSHVPGRIEKLFVTFTGEQVHKGQSIATLYSPELITAQSELLEALKLEDINPNLAEAARNKLKFWKIGESIIQNLEKNGTIQETFTIHADRTGVVTKRRVAVGDHLMQGEPLFEMVDLSKLWVLFDAYEEDLSTIKVGDFIEFSTPSIPNKVFKTNITFIDPLINPSTRVASLRTEIRNTNGQLKPEMFVNGILQKSTGTQAELSVPKSAVMWTGTRSVVYVKIPETSIPSYQFREIELGESLGSSYQVLNGLESGEEVVTNGAFVIDASAQLNNQASMMNKDVGIKNDNHIEVLPDYTASTPLAFKQQIALVSKEYLSLKTAFVSTDKDKAMVVAAKIGDILSTIDMTLLEGEAHLYWMEQLNALSSHSKKIATLADIEEQRKQFDFLSQVLINTIKVFGVTGDTLYIQHCPMAFGNKGADWISQEEGIQNPYFGDKMLACGVVKDMIGESD